MVDIDPSWINKAPDPATDPAYAAAELRRNEAVLLFGGHADRLGVREGVRPGHTPVSLAGTTITVHDAACAVYPALTSTSGPYRAALLQTAFEHDPPDGVNPRKDIVIAEIKDDDEDSSGLRLARPRYIAGTPGATPSEPAVPAGAFRLATIDVPQSGGGGATLTVNNPWTVANGGVLPVRDSSELPTVGRYAGMTAYQQDIDTLVIWDGSAWIAHRVTDTHARYIAVNPESIPNAAWTKFRAGTAISTCAHVTNIDNYDYRLETAGVWHIEGGSRFDSNSTGSRHHAISDSTNDTQRFSDISMAAAPAGTHAIGSGFVRAFPAGQLISQYLWQNSTGALNTSPTGETVHISFTLLAES